MAARGGTLHGVEVTRMETSGAGKRGAGEQFFSQDDAHRMAGMQRQSFQALEWGLAPEGDPEQDSGAA